MKNKIVIVLLVLVIAVGMIIACTSGFKLGFNYDESRKLNIEFTEEFEIKDVEEIAKSVFEKDLYKVEYTNNFESGVIISVISANDEQIDELRNKLKEKYTSFASENTETEENDEEGHEGHDHSQDFIQVIDMARVSVYDLVKIYIKPVIITSIVVLIFLAIFFRKLGFLKAFVLPLCLILGINALYISILAILRIPVNEYIIAIGALVYAFSLIGVTLYIKSTK